MCNFWMQCGMKCTADSKKKLYFIYKKKKIYLVLPHISRTFMLVDCVVISEAECARCLDVLWYFYDGSNISGCSIVDCKSNSKMVSNSLVLSQFRSYLFRQLEIPV